MGSTYLCVRSGAHGFEQRVCVKTILEAFRGRTDHMELFRREAALAASLRHPGIAGVLDVNDELGYIVYEYIDGCDLRGLMSGARFDPPLLVFVLAQISKALEYAHNRRLGGQASPVVHRDISPSNIMIDRWGNVKVIDFGIAKAIGEGQSRTIKGKLQYMSPEQAMAGDLDGRSDQFSVGVMAYEMIARVRPHDGVDERETHARVMMGEHTPISRVAPDIPAGLGEVIERMLAAKPDDRFPTMAGVLDALVPFTPSLVAYRELAARVNGAADPRTISAEADHYISVPVRSSPQAGFGGSIPGAPAPPDLSSSAVLERSPTVAADYGSLTDAPAPTETGGSWAPHIDPEVSSNPFRSPNNSRMWLALPALVALGAIGWFMLEPEPAPGAPVGGTDAATASASMQPKLPPSPVPPPVPQPIPVAGLQMGALPTPPPAPVANPQAGGMAAQSAALAKQATATPALESGSRQQRAARKRSAKRVPRARSRRTERRPAEAAPVGKGRLKIGVFPSGNVWIDGRSRGAAPVSVELRAGKHTIGAGGSSPVTKRTVIVKPDQDESMVITMSRE